MDDTVVDFAHTALHVWVRDPRVTRHLQQIPDAPFGALWPADDAPGWTPSPAWSTATAAGLRQLSTEARHADGLVALAEAEGFLDDLAPDATPADALVALDATWVALDVDARRGWDGFRAAHLADGETFADLTPAERDALARRADLPLQDPTRLQQLADEILARWPDHPVSDHALLALVRAEVLPDDPAGTDPDVLRGLLDAVRDPAIRAEADRLVTRLPPPATVSAALLDTLAEADDDDLAVATWATSRAVRLQDWERAHRWAERAAAELAQCADPDGEVCARQRYELRDVRSRLVALGEVRPATWQEALTAAAWRCQLAGRTHRGVSTATATWDGQQWAFGPWDRLTPGTACFGETTSTEVVPDEPTRVRLTFEGPAP
ncbi:MAG: hypothetical protein R3F59_33260 [Myxococcota bacterium]